MPTRKELEQRYREWWAESYPNVKPAAHAVTTAAAFALHVLENTRVSFVPMEQP